MVNNTREQLEEIFKKRRSVYMAHSSVVVKSAGTGSEITENVIKKIKNLERNVNVNI